MRGQKKKNQRKWENSEEYLKSKKEKEYLNKYKTIAGEYLLTAKSQGTDYEQNNKYVAVYSGTVSSPEGKFETQTIYFPVEYDGLVKLPNGEYMTSNTVGMLGGSYLSSNSFWYISKGYLDGTQMYSDIVMANRDSYTYEVSEGLKSFGE